MKRPSLMLLAVYFPLIGAGLLVALVFNWLKEDQRQWKLTEAAERGDLAEVQRLFAAGANLDATPVRENGSVSGFPALVGAVEHEHEDVVRFFLEHGADPETSYGDGTTPLGMAIGTRNHAIAELLLSRGASVNNATGQILTATNWNPPLDNRMIELIKRYSAITEVHPDRVPAFLTFCTKREMQAGEIARWLDEAVPAACAAARSAGFSVTGPPDVTFYRRDLRHPAPFTAEVVIRVPEVREPVPPGYYYRTAEDFECWAAKTGGSRKNVEAGWGLLEGQLVSHSMDAKPTGEMREVYHIWKSADSPDNQVEIQLGIRHPEWGPGAVSRRSR